MQVLLPPSNVHVPVLSPVGRMAVERPLPGRKVAITIGLSVSSACRRERSVLNPVFLASWLSGSREETRCGFSSISICPEWGYRPRHPHRISMLAHEEGESVRSRYKDAVCFQTWSAAFSAAAGHQGLQRAGRLPEIAGRRCLPRRNGVVVRLRFPPTSCSPTSSCPAP